MDTPGEDLAGCWDDIARQDQTVIQTLKSRVFPHNDGDYLDDIWIHVWSDDGLDLGSSLASASTCGSGVVLMADSIRVEGQWEGDRRASTASNYSVVLKDPNWQTLHTGWLATPQQAYPGDTLHINAIFFDLCDW